MTNRKYNLNEDFFEVIDTEEKAYWLGFIYADGCLPGHQSLVIELSIKDENHLQKFLDTIQSEHPIKRKEKSKSCMINIGSVKMVSDLINHGCHKNKSLTLTYPKYLNEELNKHFIRGYFDGDGCLSYSAIKETRKDRNPENITHKWTVKFVGTESFLASIVENLLLPKNKIVKDGAKAYQLKYGGSVKPFNIINSFYENCTIYLDRKHKKFKEFESFMNNKNTP